MTLRCECGSYALEITEATYPEDTSARATEFYECGVCGRTGTVSFGDGRPEQPGGCVTTDEGAGHA